MEPSIAKMLLQRYLDQTCTEEEKILVESWYARLRETGEWQWQPGEKEQLATAMEKRLMNAIKETKEPGEIKEQEQTKEREDTGLVRMQRIYFLRKWGWAAAAILVIATAAVFFVSSDQPVNPLKTNLVNAAEILPGKNGAVLTLADGSRVLLDSIENGVVALQGGAMAKVVNGTLLYEGGGAEMVYNTMTTPKGRRFHVTLSDGTEVWLNNASSIRYPTAFAGKERRVEVTGEAYFEVAKNKEMPFRLAINNKAVVEVLGTQFNVNAYENEKSISTTLIEGSVAVSSGRQLPEREQSGQKERAGNQVMLKPGQQALLRIDQSAQPGMIEVVNNIDIEKVTAWKKDLFNFDNIEFGVAMRQLERWYDIDVVYEKGVPENIELYGKITKDVTLNDLLTGLTKIGIKCRLEGRKLLIQP